jgi:hypothetical protein
MNRWTIIKILLFSSFAYIRFVQPLPNVNWIFLLNGHLKSITGNPNKAVAFILLLMAIFTVLYGVAKQELEESKRQSMIDHFSE